MGIREYEVIFTDRPCGATRRVSAAGMGNLNEKRRSNFAIRSMLCEILLVLVAIDATCQSAPIHCNAWYMGLGGVVMELFRCSKCAVQRTG